MISKSFALALLVGALAVSGFVAIDDFDEAYAADATIQLTVGTSYSNSFNIGEGLVSASTNAPGMSASTSGTTMYLSGTPSSTGTYTATAYNEYEEVMWYADLVVSSAPQPQTYTVTISCSPYAGGYVSETSLTVASGTSYSTSGRYLTVGSTTVTATATSGYAFDSWSSSSGTITSNKTITAYFESTAPTTYTCYLYYNPNGAGASGAPATQSYTGSSTSSHTFTISNDTPTRSGYNFLGWSESNTATVASYNPGGTISVPYNGSKTLYAVWQQVVTVTIHASPASGGTLSTSSVAVPSGTAYSSSGSTMTIGASLVVATPASGFSFDSWSPDGSGTVTGNMDVWAYFYTTNTSITLIQGTSYNIPLAVGQDAYDWSGGLPAGLSISWNSTDRCFYLTGTPTVADTGAVDILNVGEEVIGTFFITIVSNEYTVTIHASPASGGTLSTSSVAVPSGTAYSSSGSTMTIGTTSVVATPASGFSFDSWSPDGSGTVTGNMDVWAYFYSTNTSISLVQGTAYSLPLAAGQDADDYTGTVPAGMSVAWNSTDRCFYLTGTPTASGTSGVDILDVSDQVIRTFFFTVTANDFTVTIHKSPASGGSLVPSSVAVPSGTAYSSSGSTMTIGTTSVVATPATGFSFDSWSPDGSGTVTGNMDVWAYFYSTNTSVTLVIDTEYSIALAAGQDADDYTGTVPAGMSVAWSSTDRCFYLTGTPTASGTSGVDILDVSDQVIMTFFFTVVDPSSEDGVYWSNGTGRNPTYNGRIDLIFELTNSTAEHIISADLFTATVTNGVAVWEDSGYSLRIYIDHPSGKASVGAQLLLNGTVVASNINHGNWPTYGTWKHVMISLNTEDSVIMITPVKTFTNFNEYTLYSQQQQTVLDYSQAIGSTAIPILHHQEEPATGETSPLFSVVATKVFLNTYGAVLFDPTINIHDYFPQYDSLRLNFYSFALYGDSLSINGQTYPVVGDKITIEYVDDQQRNHIVPPLDWEGEVKTKTFTLSNIYATWDRLTGHCTLTFVSERWTIDLGTFAVDNMTVSFGGMWYFTTMLYEPSESTEKSLGDWKAFPETDSITMILIYLGVLALAAIAAVIHVRRGGNATIDLIIIACAGVVGLIMLG